MPRNAGRPHSTNRALGRPIRERGFVTHLFLFVVVSALTGVLVAGLAIPFAGMMGLGARSMTDSFQNMPSVLPKLNPPERSRMLDADGNLLATFYDQNRVNLTSLDDISPLMRKSIIAIEDWRFYQHGPMDAQGAMRAFVRNSQAGGVSQGGSSITQQYVKQVLAESANTPEQRAKALEESYGRKLQELRYAVEVEKTMSKDEILLNYLNIVYFGDLAYGIESAARHYFSVPAKQLTLTQSATLAGLVRNPPASLSEETQKAMLSRRNLVLSRMYETKAISEAEARKAMESPLGLKITDTRNGCANSDYPFFCDYARSLLLGDDALGNSREERSKLINEGGLTIRTTLDVKAQNAAEAALRARLYPTDKVIGAVSLVEPGTGHIKAMAQSRPMGNDAKKGDTYINYNVDQKHNGGLGFQPGSTFKPFVAAAAIKQGIGLDERFPSPSSTTITGPVKTCPNGQPGAVTTPWRVSNSTKAGASSIDMVTGAARSVNTFFANLEKRTGICDAAKIAAAAGVKRGDGKRLEQYKPFVLGVDDVTPLSMAEAYATFAARGKHCTATPLVDVLDRKGTKLPIQGANCKQTIPQDVADAVNYVLRQVVDGDDPSRTAKRMSMLKDGREAAGKTGTNDKRVNVAFAGYTTNLAGFAIIADAHPTKRTLLNQTLGGRKVDDDEVWGGRLSGPIWLAAMKGALKGTESPDFVEPDPKTIRGVKVDVPYVVGMSQSKATRVLEAADFQVSIGGSDYSTLPRGTVIKQYPSKRAGSGSVITLTLSNGQQRPKPKLPEDPREDCNKPNPPPKCNLPTTEPDPNPDPTPTFPPFPRSEDD